MFGFDRFGGVSNVQELEKKLDGIWMENRKMVL